ARCAALGKTEGQPADDSSVGKRIYDWVSRRDGAALRYTWTQGSSARSNRAPHFTWRDGQNSCRWGAKRNAVQTNSQRDLWSRKRDRSNSSTRRQGDRSSSCTLFFTDRAAYRSLISLSGRREAQRTWGFGA